MPQAQNKKYEGISKVHPGIKELVENCNEVKPLTGTIQSFNYTIQQTQTGKMQIAPLEKCEALEQLRTALTVLKDNNKLNPEQGARLINVESLLQVVGSEIEVHKTHETDLQHEVEEAKKHTHFKSMFIANVSHEIRNQVNAITGFVNLLSKDPSAKESEEFLNTIKSSGDLLTHLLNDIIDISKFEEGKMPLENSPFNFHETVNNSISSLALKAREKGLYLTVDFDSVNKMLVGDPYRFSQVLFNLVSNAIKFTEKGGVKIGFLITNVSNHSTSKIKLKCLVSDTGIGMTEEGKEKIFHPFIQADNSIGKRFGGSGVGLTLSKDLVELMEGEMGISKTKPGDGTEFYFIIPFEVQKNTIDKIILNTKDTNYWLEKPLNILLADDDIVNQKLMTRVLGAMNCTVTIAADGIQVLQEIEQKQFDVVLMDIEMPGLSGCEVAKIMREKLNNNLPIIGLTAHTESDIYRQGTNAGINEFIFKPVYEEQVFNTLTKYLPGIRV